MTTSGEQPYLGAFTVKNKMLAGSTDSRAFGVWLKKMRVSKGLEQRDIEERGGPSQSYVSDMEKFNTYPKPQTQVRLANALGIPLSEVVAAVARAEALKKEYNQGTQRTEWADETPLPDGAIPVLPIRTVKVPLIREFAEGVPLFASQNIEKFVDVDISLVGSETLITFQICVKGDNMIGAGVLPGDMVVARQAETAQSGEMVVVLQDGMTMGSIFWYTRRGKEISLESEPFPRQREQAECPKWRVVGIVKHIQRFL